MTFTSTPTPTFQVTLNKSVSPSGTIHSEDVLIYTLNITVSGGSANGIVITDTLPANVTYQGPLGSTPAGLPAPVYNSAISQLVWILPALAPRNYQLSYSTKVNDLVPAGTTITNNAQLTYPGLSAPLTSSTTVTVLGQYTVKIGVYNEAGELVKTILTQQFSQPINVVTLNGTVITSLNGANNAVQIYYKGTFIGQWDGTTSSGDPATNGVYHIKIDNIDQLGAVTTMTQQVMVNRSLYQATVLIYNEAGEVVKHLYAYVDDPGKAAVIGVQLSTTVIKPSYNPVGGGVPAQLSITLSNGTTVMWEGRGDNGSIVQTGQYFIEVHSKDGVGGTQRLSNRFR